jgi:two-component system, NtrC family, sensor histidine kinase PilS
MKPDERNKDNSLQSQPEQRRMATTYVAYRIILAIGLLLLNLIPEARMALEIPPSVNFPLIAGLYFATAVMAGLIFLHVNVSIATSARLMLWSDILLVPLLMLVAGKFAFGLGLLLAISFALGNSLIGQGVLIRATAASLLVVAALLFGEYVTGQHFIDYSNALLLVFSFYAIGVLASYLGRKVTRTQVLLDRQLIDIHNLTEVNAFIVQQLPSGALVVDNNHRLQTGNAAAWQLLDVDEADSGTPLARISPGLDQALSRWSANQQEAASPQPGSHVDQAHDYEASFSAFGNASHGGVLINLADLRQLSDRARQMKLASLGQLVAGVAHEVRNPLNAIQQSAQLLEESTGLAASDRQLAQIIDRQSRRLNRLVTDILDASRNGTNTPLELEPAEWFAEFLDHYQLSPGTSAVNIELEVDPGSGKLLFDPDQLQQILWNLLDNAKKHSRPLQGDVEIRLTCRPGPDDAHTIIAVCDNGSALDVEDEERLFDPFYTTRNSGVGLGLFIAHELSRNNDAELNYRRIQERNCFQLLCMTTSDKS